MKPSHKLIAMAAAAVFAVSGIAPAMAHDPISNANLNAQDLRALLSAQLGEHVMLAASATGAALAGRDAQFKAAAKSLDDNSIDLSKSIGVVYGPGAQDAFLPLWRKHIGFVVDYTTALAAKDKTKSDKAVSDLLQYAEDFGAFLNSANPNLPKAAVAGLVKDHIVGLKNVVDAQAAGDIKKQFAELRMAYMHMDMIGSALAGAIGKQFPAKFAGAADDAAGNLRTGLNLLLSEHTYLAARATGAALGGRTAEFTEAANALDGNSVDLSKAIGSVYGQGAQDAFLPLWRKHIGFVVDYTTGLGAKDKTKSDKAVTDLVAYSQDFGAFLSSANPNLPTDVVAGLVKTHILTLKDVIDAQAAGDQPKVYDLLRGAYHHMASIADPLAGAIIKQFPAKFGGVAKPAMVLPASGGAQIETPWMALAILAAAALMAGAGSALILRRARG